MDGALIDSIRIALAAYLLAVAVGAVFGFHRPLIAYPIRVAYSTFVLVVDFLSRGHVHLMAPARKVRRRGAISLRNVKDHFAEWRVERAEARGEVVETPAMTWQSAGEVGAGVSRESPFSEPPAPLCPVHGVPLSSPLLFDEATGARYPDGTTHAQVCLRPAPAAPPVQDPPVAPPVAPPEQAAGRPAGGMPRPPVSSPWDDDEEIAPPRLRG